MGIYRTPYTKFKFSNKTIDNQFYLYLKGTTQQEIISEIKNFRDKEVSEFQADHKIERVCLLIGRVLALFGLSSFIVIINFDDIPFLSLFTFGVLSIFPALLLLSFTMSYALTLKELKKGITQRKTSLLKAEKIAKSSNNFEEFLHKITIK